MKYYYEFIPKQEGDNSYFNSKTKKSIVTHIRSLILCDKLCDGDIIRNKYVGYGYRKDSTIGIVQDNRLLLFCKDK